IDDSDLVRAPMVRSDLTLAQARSVLENDNARWAVVLDAHDNLRGWLNAEMCQGTGMVADEARRMEAYVERDAPLKEALATMLRYDAGWVAVLEGSKLVGVLTPQSLHEALRRSVHAAADDIEVADVDLETVGPLRCK